MSASEMVDLGWDSAAATSPNLGNQLNHLRISNSCFPISASEYACSSYEHYIRLAELRNLWNRRDFPEWRSESMIKPALQALEITFSFISAVLSDPRPYANITEWRRRMNSLSCSQIRLISLLCEEDEEEDEGDEDGSFRGAPTVDLRSSTGVVPRQSSCEVWVVRGEAPVVNKTSENSLLPSLLSWQKSRNLAEQIVFAIECEMRNCNYTLGIGEPNLAAKPNLRYDAVCRPNEVYNVKRTPYDHIDNNENQNLYATHQILESWIHVAKQVLSAIADAIESKKFERAANYCFILERIWKLLSEIEDLHLLMDPDDFLRLKSQLQLKSMAERESFCFRSRSLIEITKLCKDLKHKVPEILVVTVDPNGAPVIQEAAMKLYSEKKDFAKVHLFQGMQAVESALKSFFYGYLQVLVAVMGSLEGKGNVLLGSHDSLSRLVVEPTYFPSLDAAKTFLGEFWSHHC